LAGKTLPHFSDQACKLKKLTKMLFRMKNAEFYKKVQIPKKQSIYSEDVPPPVLQVPGDLFLALCRLSLEIARR
jgi:hypothetical protein